MHVTIALSIFRAVQRIPTRQRSKLQELNSFHTGETEADEEKRHLFFRS
jgi:hypothetical protein